MEGWKLIDEEVVDTEFLKEFAFVNNAKSYSLLYKDDGDNCENML